MYSIKLILLTISVYFLLLNISCANSIALADKNTSDRILQPSSSEVSRKNEQVQSLIKQRRSEGKDVSEVIPIIKQSKIAMQKGDSEKALGLLDKAIALLEGKDSISNKTDVHAKDEQVQPVTIEINVESEKVEVIEAVPDFKTGKDVKSYGSGFKTYQMNAENGKVTLKVSSIPLFIKEIKDEKSSDKSKTIFSSNKISSFGLLGVDRFEPSLIDIGADWVRYSGPPGLIWDAVEPKKGEFNWSKLDTIYNATHQNGISMLVNVITFNNWDQGIRRGDERRKPGGKLVKNIEAYQSFLEKAVKRYPFIDAWQIENEPNLPFYWNDTPENYLVLLKASYDVIKRVNPNALVVIGGISDPLSLNRGFWSEVFQYLEKKAGKERYFDVFDCHWFLHMEKSSESIVQLTDYIKDVRQKLDRIGYADVPIWITEMASHSGNPTHGRFQLQENSENQQASELVKLYVHALNLGVSKIFWVGLTEWHGFGKKANTYFDNTGLINNPDNDGESHKKLAYYSYKKLTETLKGFHWQDIKTVNIEKNVRAYKFSKNGQTIYIIWSE